MGKVVAKIKLTNYLDLELKRLNLRREKPRAVLTDALVDTGATRLYLKSSVIKALGLRKEGEVVSKTTARHDNSKANPLPSFVGIGLSCWSSSLGISQASYGIEQKHDAAMRCVKLAHTGAPSDCIGIHGCHSVRTDHVPLASQ